MKVAPSSEPAFSTICWRCFFFESWVHSDNESFYTITLGSFFCQAGHCVSGAAAVLLMWHKQVQVQNGSSQYFGTKVHLKCFCFLSFVRNTPLLLVSVTSFLMAWKSITEPGRCISLILSNSQHSGKCFGFTVTIKVALSGFFRQGGDCVDGGAALLLHNRDQNFLYLTIMLCKSCIIPSYPFLHSACLYGKVSLCWYITNILVYWYTGILVVFCKEYSSSVCNSTLSYFLSDGLKVVMEPGRCI